MAAARAYGRPTLSTELAIEGRERVPARTPPHVVADVLPAPQRALQTPAQAIALQRTAGNAAVVGLLQRSPDTVTPGQPDELLTRVLQGAAARAGEAHLVLKPAGKPDAPKRFASARTDLLVQLDEALLLSGKPGTGRGAFQAASSLFGAAAPLVALAESRGWEGASALKDKLAALKASLEKQGYRAPAAGAKTEEPHFPGTRDLERTARLGFAAARTELEAGLKKLAAEKKAGRRPTQLYGGPESVVHLKTAAVQLGDVTSLSDDYRYVVGDLEGIGELALNLLRQGEGLDGAKALLSEINLLNRHFGLDAITPFGSPTAASATEAAAERETGKAQAEARKEVTTFEREATDFAKKERRWEESNFIDFLTKTSQNPRVSWGQGTAFGIFAEALSSAAGAGVVTFLKHRATKAAAGGTGAAVGGAIGNVPGAAVGFVVGILVEYGVTLLLDHITGKSDGEARAAAQAVAQNNQLIQSQLAVLNAKEDKATAATRTAAKDLTARVDAAANPQEVSGIRHDLKVSTDAFATKPSASDRSLMTRMLADWVLQHAGDENEANTDTSDDQWDDARTLAFGKGRSLDSHPEIFAHQTLLHWEDLGLPGQALTAPMIKDATAAGSNGAERIMDAYDGKAFEFTRTTKPDAFIRFVEHGEGRSLTDDGKQAIREGRFKLKATFDLREYHGAVYVDKWDYDLELIGPDMTQWWEMAHSGRSATAGAINAHKARESSVDFDVNPDDD